MRTPISLRFNAFSHAVAGDLEAAVVDVFCGEGRRLREQYGHNGAALTIICWFWSLAADLFVLMVRIPTINSPTTVRWYSSPRARAQRNRMTRECQVRICERLGVAGHQSQDRKAIGLTIPEALRLGADEVIE